MDSEEEETSAVNASVALLAAFIEYAAAASRIDAAIVLVVVENTFEECKEMQQPKQGDKK